MEATYKASFFNKYLLDNGMKFKDFLTGPNSISKRLDRIKSDARTGKYPDLLGSDGSFSNVLIDNIFSRPKEDPTELAGPDFIAYKPNKSGDNNLENEIIRAWEELWDSDYKEVKDFAKDLAIYSFYTSGDAFGKNNIFRYVPNSIKEELGYFDYIRNLEQNPEDAVKDIKVFQTMKDLWWNDHVVPNIEYYYLDSSRETIEEEGRPVYRAIDHEDSGFTVVNKKGNEVPVPGIIYEPKKQGIISFNKNSQPIYPPFKKVKLDRNNDPRTTFLYEYIGINEDEQPVYRLINKKGINYRGNVLVENGRNRSILKYNNIVPKGHEIIPEEPITWVTDLTPIKASLQAKVFNKSGEFNTDMMADVQQTVTVTNAEPLSYQEWVKDYQTQKGEADAEAAYQQYLDNFQYDATKSEEAGSIQEPVTTKTVPTEVPVETTPTDQQEVPSEEQPVKSTTDEFLDYANQFGFTDETALLKPELEKAKQEAKEIEDKYVFTFNDGYKINLPFQLNDQQRTALHELEKFIEDGGTEITLSGYAGTGKSTIIGIFSKWLEQRIGRNSIVYTSPTHRANVVTKQNNPNSQVCTLSALFGFIPDTDEAMSRSSLDLRELEFRAKNQMKYEPGQLIIIDEASMVQDGLYDYIQEVIAKFGATVIYVGDQAQLRPVGSDHISKIFTTAGVPQVTLTKVERTGDNPILKEATRLRQGEGLSYVTDINEKGQGVLYSNDPTVIDNYVRDIVTSEEFSVDPLHFRILTGTNKAVSTYNARIRALRYGKFAKSFVVGDIIMGYSNKLRTPAGEYKLINSGDYVVQDVTETTIKFPTDKEVLEFKGFILSLRPTSGTVADDFKLSVIDKNEPDSKLFKIVEYKDRLWAAAKQAKKDGNTNLYRDLVQAAYTIDNQLNLTKNLEDQQGRLKIKKAIDYGYAQTVWKSQGSTYSKTLILADEIDTFGYGKDVVQLRNELRYVAVSRAKNFVIINTSEEVKKPTKYDDEILIDTLEDEEFGEANESDLRSAASSDAFTELRNAGVQRKKECE